LNGESVVHAIDGVMAPPFDRSPGSCCELELLQLAWAACLPDHLEF